MMGEAAKLRDQQWQRLNLIWVTFFFAVGGINIYVAYSFSEPTWVKFKLFGMLGLTFAFVLIQTLWLMRTMKNNEPVEHEPE